MADPVHDRLLTSVAPPLDAGPLHSEQRPAHEHATPERPNRPLMRREPASRYLLQVWGIRRAPPTLAKLAVYGGGPRFYKDGRWPLYDPDDLDAWARSLL